MLLKRTFCINHNVFAKLYNAIKRNEDILTYDWAYSTRLIKDHKGI